MGLTVSKNNETFYLIAVLVVPVGIGAFLGYTYGGLTYALIGGAVGFGALQLFDKSGLTGLLMM